MQPNSTKTCYNPYLLVAFYLNCLPENIFQFIPNLNITANLKTHLVMVSLSTIRNLRQPRIVVPIIN